MLILIALFAISGNNDNPTSPLLGNIESETFDYAMTDVQRLHFDDKGELVSKLSSPYLSHYPGSKTFKLESPELHFNMSKQIWLLEAKNGILHEDSRQLNFQEKVILTNDNPLNKDDVNPAKNVTMNMTDLVFNLDKQQAFSPYPIKVNTDLWKMEGVGISIDILNQQMTILDKVYASHE